MQTRRTNSILSRPGQSCLQAAIVCLALALGLAAAAAPASAQQSSSDTASVSASPSSQDAAPKTDANSGPLAWHGITLYGTLDVGVGWVSHGLPENGYNYEGESLVNRNGNHSQFLIAPNNLSQTGLGVKGKEEFLPGWFGVFNASTGINPQSGHLANLAATNTLNAGLPRDSYSFAGDGARAGQFFNDELFAGISSTDFGTLTAGRQRALGTDAVPAYDPAGGAYSFSFIGYNGLMAGGGDTQDTRWDDALKYRATIGLVHVGLMYKFADGQGGCYSASAAWTGANCTPVESHNTAYAFDFGGAVDNFSADVIFQHVNQAISVVNPLLLGPASLTAPYPVDGRQHQYKPHQRRQPDRHEQYRIWHRDRQHRNLGRCQIYLGPVQVLCRIRTHTDEESGEPVGRGRHRAGRLSVERRRRQ